MSQSILLTQHMFSRFATRPLQTPMHVLCFIRFDIIPYKVVPLEHPAFLGSRQQVHQTSFASQKATKAFRKLGTIAYLINVAFASTGRRVDQSIDRSVDPFREREREREHIMCREQRERERERGRLDAACPTEWPIYVLGLHLCVPALVCHSL